MLLRNLNPVEEAFATMNNAFALNAVIVLRVEAPHLATTDIESALRLLLGKHEYLLFKIEYQKGKRVFVNPEKKSFPEVTVVERDSSDKYLSVTEIALNTRAKDEGPLLDVIHVHDHAEPASEIVLKFHHSVVDSTLLRVFLDDFLSVLGKVYEPMKHPVSVTIDSSKKPISQKIPGWIPRVKFIGGQMVDEMKYRGQSVKQPRVASSENSVYRLQFTLNESRQILVACARESVSVNCLINAAVLLAVLKLKHPGSGNVLARTMTFADLRSLLLPPAPPTVYGCYIAMLRFTLSINEDDNVIAAGKKLQKAMTTSLRTGEFPLFFAFAKKVAMLTLKMNSSRMALSALSFIGLLDLGPDYGTLRLLDVQAYITNNRLGPEFTGFGKILHGKIGLDFCALADETTPDEALQIIDEVKSLVLSVVSGK